MKKTNSIFAVAIIVTATLAGCTIDAKHDRNFNVTFNSNGGSEVATQVVNNREKVAKPLPNPTKAKNTFDGWFTDNGIFETPVAFPYTVTSDITFYAKWNINTFTVTFNSNGGSGVTTQTIIEGEKVTKPSPNPIKEKNTFGGWYKDNNAFNNEWNFTTDIVTSDITLNAKWNVNTYTVTFNSNGGSGVTTQTIIEGEKATEPAEPTKADHSFEGWYTDNDSFIYRWDFANRNVTTNVTLFAKWENSGGDSKLHIIIKPPTTRITEVP